MSLNRKSQRLLDSALRVLLSAMVPVSLSSCNLAPTPPDSMDEAEIGQAGDPHTLILSNNKTGETHTFVIHEESDEEELVMTTSGDEEEVQTRIRLDRSELEVLSAGDLPGDLVSLEHTETDETHPGSLLLLQSPVSTGTVTYTANYFHEEQDIDFDIVAVVDQNKSDAQAQTAAVIIVVVSIAAAVCLAELAISTLKTDCNTNCRQTCAPRGVHSCSLDVNFGAQTGPFKVGCFTSCETVCN